MNTLAVMLLTISAVAAVMAVVREAIREAWGRKLDRELSSYLNGSPWVTAADVCEALLTDLIRWSDRSSQLAAAESRSLS